MFDATASSASMGAACEIAPVALGDILDRIARRLAWYGLPQSGIRAVEIRDHNSVVATLTVSGNGTFREEFDGRTGSVRRREAVNEIASQRYACIQPV